MKSLKRAPLLLFYLFFAFFTFQITAQTNTEKKPLADVLSILQKQYNYQFSYADDVINDVFVIPPPKDLAFNDILNYLRKKTGLLFNYLNESSIVIQEKKSNYFVCGYVIDDELKSPLEGASIVSQNGTTITNSFGYFELEIKNAASSLTISHLGYRSSAKNVEDFDTEDCSYFYLTEKAEPLQEILLSNFLVRGIDKIADGSFKVNYSKFDIVPGLIETDVLQTIQSLPGIQSVNETISNINIRGGTNDQNLILWDGIKMYQSGHFFGLISMFNPLMTSEVTVVKNGSDTSLSNGVSGSILMNTDSKISTDFEGSLGSNFTNLDGFIDVPIGQKSALQITARKGINDLITGTPTYTNYFERISQDTEVSDIADNKRSFDFFDTSLRLNYQLSNKDFLRLNFLIVNNELSFTETATLNQIEISRQSNLNQNTIAGGIFYERKWNNAFSTSMQIYESDYQLEAKNVNVLEQQRLLQENKVSETSFLLNSLYKYSTFLSFTNGYQFVETGITNLTDIDDPIIVDLKTRVLREHAVFSQLNYISDSDKFSVKAGLRYNYISNFNKHLFEPRLVLNYELLENVNLEIAGEFKHQSTSQIVNFQNDFLGIEKRRWRLSNNDNVPIIKSQQASLGLSYNKNDWIISAEGYIKRVTGITSQSQGFLDRHIFDQTIGEYNIIGTDLLLNKKIKKFTTWLSYSFGINEYRFKEFTNEKFPSNLDIRHAVNFGATYSTNKLKVAAAIKWHSGLPVTEPIKGNELIGSVINYEASNSARLKEYFRVDISAMYDFNFSDRVRIRAGVSVWNLLNTENIISRFYRTNGIIVEEINQKALGLTPNAVFRMSF